jgi:DNA-binding GntR family transcriptional regulator
MSNRDVSPSIPRRSVLSDETYELIRNLILDHKIAPGAKVNIDALATKLNVSQTPIREALARLESTGLTVKVALKGYTTTNLLSLKEFRDLYQLRNLIEPWAAEEAANNVTAVGKTALKSEMEAARMTLKYSDIEQVHALTEHDARFHTLITKMSDNHSVVEAFERTHCHLHLFRLYIATKNQEAGSKNKKGTLTNFEVRTAATIREHEVIASAITSGNAKKAYDAMQSHILSSMKRFTPAAKLMEDKGKASK